MNKMEQAQADIRAKRGLDDAPEAPVEDAAEAASVDASTLAPADDDSEE